MERPKSGPRVVLLARAGTACDRVRMGLVEAGAELVLEADPTALEAQQLRDAQPQVAMVVLDALTEPAFDRLEPVLVDLGVEVMLEEADVAAAREGWDAARWVRHLAAKLHRHGNVLPPGADAAADQAHVPATVTATFDVVDVAVDPDAGSSQPVQTDEMPSALTSDDELAVIDMPDVPSIEFEHASSDVVLAFDGDVAASTPPHPLSDEFTPGVDAGVYLSFDPVAAEMDEATQDADQIVGFDFALHEDFALPGSAAQASAFDVPSLDLVFESELASGEPAGDSLPLAADVVDGDVGNGPEFSLDVSPVPVAAEPQVSFGSGLELALDDAPAAPVAAPASRFTRDLGDLERRIASLELVDTAADIAPAPARTTPAGAAVILAGIGGPDAVRQLLGALPAEFPRAVLIQQRLDGARYDRLVAQMRRASSLPVELAGEGDAVQAGVAYIVPSGVGVAATSDGMRFDGGGDLLSALAPGDSAVVLLSGTDMADVERLSEPAWTAALLAAQAAEGCYDATAPMALASRGGISGQPAELAQHLVERWNVR